MKAEDAMMHTFFKDCECTTVSSNVVPNVWVRTDVVQRKLCVLSVAP